MSILEIKGVNKYFNRGKQNENHVINDTSLSLPDKGIVAFFGRSGCGKTTLLNVIGGLDSFSAGTILIDGQNVRKNTDTIRNKYVGYIFQNYNLNKSETVFDNVADALRLCGITDRQTIEERVFAALGNVGMDKYALRTPNTLSGGQQQRVAIARAIVKNPHIILADEPTGNLDEKNTRMIMDLLKSISRDRLVLLVTHEADLVDHYCDVVIELSDGSVVNRYENADATGLNTRDKNTVYLGDMQKKTLSGEFANIEFYGDEIDGNVKLRIINNGGKLLLSVDTPGVRVIDKSSEIRLLDSSFEEIAAQDKTKDVDMSALPPINGKKYGKLFSFAYSVKSGFYANFKQSGKTKKGKISKFAKKRTGRKLLFCCMALFAMVIVFISSIFGTSIKNYLDAESTYNHNVFYVWVENAETAEALYSLGSESGIDFVTASRYSAGDRKYYFTPGYFSSFASRSYGTDFYTNAVPLPQYLAADLTTVAGSAELKAENDVLITTAAADKLLERSTFGYISDYGDLIGLRSESQTLGKDQKLMRIAGVVESDETAVYFSQIAYARAFMRYHSDISYLVAPASDYGISLDKGTAMYVLPDAYESAFKNDEEITVSGVSLKVDTEKKNDADIREKLYDIGSEIVFLISDDDYFAIGTGMGVTDSRIYVKIGAYDNEKYPDGYPEDYEFYPEPASIDVGASADVFISESVSNVMVSSGYVLIHSFDPQKTDSVLRNSFDTTSTNRYRLNLITPDDLFEEKTADCLTELIAQAVVMAVTIAILCVCMYFIARSSLLSRIKEIGIYRAIGVSKKNLVFKFFIESLVLTTLTVFIGYLVTSCGIFYIRSITSLADSFFYYPAWLATSVGIFIYAVCTLCGILPVLSLVRKTPAQILAKYDI